MRESVRPQEVIAVRDTVARGATPYQAGARRAVICALLILNARAKSVRRCPMHAFTDWGPMHLPRNHVDTSLYIRV
jgi:hypothetical protein